MIINKKKCLKNSQVFLAKNFIIFLGRWRALGGFNPPPLKKQNKSFVQ